MNLIPWRNKRDNGHGGMTSPSDFRTDLDQLFDSFLSGFSLGGNGFGALGPVTPALDVRETDDEVTIKAEIPGIKPEDLDITVTGNVLTLSGEKREETERKAKDVYHAERRFGSFRRSLTLPSAVDPRNVAAHYENGVVTIGLKKRPEAMSKRIPVKSG